MAAKIMGVITLKHFYLFTLVIALSFSLQAQTAASHVFIVVEENTSYSSVIGNTDMPYLNNLASKYALATNYYANTHPSIGNYFMLTTGQIITNDDSFSGTVTAPNIIRSLLSIGKTWKTYAESLPSVGYTGGDQYPYLKHHNPAAYLSDVLNSTAQKNNLVPFTQFATDLSTGNLPNFSFIVPNADDDAHDGTLAQADSWLQKNIQPLISSSAFQPNDVLVVLFDEGYASDTTNGGGQVAMVVVGPNIKPGYRSTTFYQHQSTLRMMEKALGITTFTGAAATAPDMGEFFASSVAPPPSSTTCAPPSTAGVNLCSPLSGSTVTSPVNFVAQATPATGQAISAMFVYLDDVLVYQGFSNSLNISVPVSQGAHNIRTQVWDTSGALYKAGANINVTTGTATCSAPASAGVTLCSPVEGATVSSPVHFVAKATPAIGQVISAMYVFVDDVLVYKNYLNYVDINVAVAKGSHNIRTQVWDTSGALYKAGADVTVQ